MRWTIPLALALTALVAGCDDDSGTDPGGTGGGGAASGCGSCPAGKTCCVSWGEHRCVDTDSNPVHCGSCGNGCSMQSVCQGGDCIAAEPCSDAGTCTAGACCPGMGYCCPDGTECVSSVPDFTGCCPIGDVCVCTGGNCPVSRREHKKDIEYLNQAKLAQLRDQLLRVRLATYRYRAEPGSRAHLGFIMEDVEPSIAADSQRGVVDLYSYTSMAVAALQVQATQIAALQREVETLRKQVAQQRH